MLDLSQTVQNILAVVEQKKLLTLVINNSMAEAVSAHCCILRDNSACKGGVSMKRCYTSHLIGVSGFTQFVI